MYKLKKLKTGLFGLIIGLSISANAQEVTTDNGLISYLPERANGFLIMDKVGNPEIETWDVEIATIGYDVATDEYTFSTVYETTVTESYYTQISEDYISGEYFVKIQAINDLGVAVAQTDWAGLCVGCIQDFMPCYWECVGSTYAYSLQLWVDGATGGSSFIKLMGAQPDDGTPYYYQYMSDAQFSAGSGDASLLSYYGVPEWNPYGQGVGDKIIRMTGVVGADGYTSSSGSPLSGIVYGVKKWLGPWQNLQGATSPTIAAGDGQCVQIIGYALDKMNYSPEFDGDMELTCDGLGGSGSSGPEPPSPDPCDDLPWDEYWDCVGGYVGLIEPSEIAPLSPFWNDDVRDITLYPFMPDSPVEPIVLTKDDFYDIDMEFHAPTISLGEGLYLYEVHYNNSAIQTTFFDNTAAIEFSWEQAGFLEVVFAPVPIIGDDFAMNLVAYESISFTYRLFDFNGVELHSQEVVMNPGDEETIVIEPIGGIPSGELINRFDFSDGSQKSIVTMK